MKQKSWIAVAMLSLATAPAHAESKCSVDKVAELPVTMAYLSPQVRVKINGKDAVFIADSGAWYSNISPGSAAEYGLKLRDLPPWFYLSGVGGTFKPKYTVVDSFTIAGVSIPKVEFVVGGSEVGSVGLLGQNVLALFDTEFDLANGAIRLIRSQGCGKADLAYWVKPGGSYSVLQTERSQDQRPHIIAPIYINGVRLRAIFDTGASTSFLSLQAAARIGLTPTATGVVSAGVTGGLGRSLVSTWIGPVASVKIGDEEIHNTRLRFGGDMTDVDMLIGADFFLSHRVYWSNAAHKLFFSFNGGHVFDLRYLEKPDGAKPNSSQTKTASGSGSTSTDDGPAPTDAEGYSRRGSVMAARGDTSKALADYDQAIKLSPDNIEYLRQRALLRAQLHEPIRAVEDVDRLLKLKPDDVEALVMRAQMRVGLDPKADVRSDVDAAAAAASKASDRRLALAGLYENIDDFPKAIAQYDLWIAVHPDDNRRLEALNGRCWARAMANVELDRALKDCNSAVGSSPHRGDFLDSRGMVRLRMGDYSHAIADYNAALKEIPDMAWSHYGRGIAQLRIGKKAEGEADIAKAKSLDKDLEAKAKKHGILP